MKSILICFECLKFSTQCVLPFSLAICVELGKYSKQEWPDSVFKVTFLYWITVFWLLKLAEMLIKRSFQDWQSLCILSNKARVCWWSEQWKKRLSLTLSFSNLKEAYVTKLKAGFIVLFKRIFKWMPCLIFSLCIYLS